MNKQQKFYFLEHMMLTARGLLNFFIKRSLSLKIMEASKTTSSGGAVAVIDLKNVSEILTPGVQQLRKLFEDNNYEFRLCGGAVRDILSGTHTGFLL